MKKAEIKVGGLYTARVLGNFVTVRVDAIREIEQRRSPGDTAFGGIGRTYKATTVYNVTNLKTDRKTTFRSAAKFRGEVKPLDSRNKCSKCGTQLTGAYPGGFELVVCYTCRQKALEPKQEASAEADPTLAVPATTGEATGAQGTESEKPSSVMPTTDATTVGAVQSSKEGEQGSDPTEPALVAVPTSTNPKTTTEGAATGLAGKITAARSVRVVGLPVAGMTPNEEQEDILAAAAEPGLRVLVVGAGAGTGKTATLKMLEQVMPGRGQYTAFNASLVAEGKTKFSKAACNTTHSLAFRAVGRTYQHRLGGERMRSGQVARILGIEAQTVLLRGMGEPDAKGKPTDKPKVLQAEFLAGQVLAAVKRFCQSADREIGATHLRYIDGIDAADGDRRGCENNDRVRDYLLPFCSKAWADLSSVNGQLPFSHDCYVKLWQLGEGVDRPVIAADYILLDEAQDTAPVFLSILQQQTHAMLVFVGDSNQAIYEWRGAVDAMKAYPDAERRMLSQSYRFGQAVADVANAVLATLDEPTDLVMRGMPTIPSRVAAVESPRCYLYRTNAGAVSRVMVAMKAGKKPHLIGGGDEVVRWCQAALDLQARRGTRHPELCCFDTWAEVVEYSKTDEGGDLKLMVKLVTEFRAGAIKDALKDMPKEEDADLVVSTAHKSKGREWDTVKLGPDFPTTNKMTDADRRLLYVAATRAKLTLDITECPPFCGAAKKADDGWNGEGGWVPGIEVEYTQPMPSAEEQAAWLAAKSAPASPQVAPDSAPAQIPAQPTPDAARGKPAMGNGNGNTWAKGRNGGWVVRGRPGQTGRVKVSRRNGSTSEETIKRVVWQDEEVALYEV